MRALTVRQPWASLLVQGRKPYENRTRDPGVRPGGEWVAVHAAVSLHDALDWARSLAPDVDPASLPFGAIVGLVWMEPGVRVEEVESPWACGPICLPCSDDLALPAPIPCRGMLGLWRVPPDVLARLEEVVGPLAA